MRWHGLEYTQENQLVSQSIAGVESGWSDFTTTPTPPPLTSLLSLGCQAPDQLPQGEQHAEHQLALFVYGVFLGGSLRRLAELLLADRGRLRVRLGEQGLPLPVEYVEAVDNHLTGILCY